MSQYATVEELTAKLGSGVYAQLTDRVNSTTADDDVGQQLLDAAETRLHMALGGRYRTPFDPSLDAALAAALRTLTLDLAAYQAYVEHPDKPEPRRGVVDAHRETLKYLDDIAAGKKALPGLAVIAGAVSTGHKPTAIGEAKVFSMEKMRGH